jgi:hypothetical protein
MLPVEIGMMQTQQNRDFYPLFPVWRKVHLGFKVDADAANEVLSVRKKRPVPSRSAFSCTKSIFEADFGQGPWPNFFTAFLGTGTSVFGPDVRPRAARNDREIVSDMGKVFFRLTFAQARFHST